MRWELRIYAGNLSTDALVEGVDRRRTWIANYLADLGPARVIAITLVAVMGMILVQTVRKRDEGTGTGNSDASETDYDIV